MCVDVYVRVCICVCVCVCIVIYAYSAPKKRVWDMAIELLRILFGYLIQS